VSLSNNYGTETGEAHACVENNNWIKSLILKAYREEIDLKVSSYLGGSY